MQMKSGVGPDDAQNSRAVNTFFFDPRFSVFRRQSFVFRHCRFHFSKMRLLWVIHEEEALHNVSSIFKNIFKQFIPPRKFLASIFRIQYWKLNSL